MLRNKLNGKLLQMKYRNQCMTANGTDEELSLMLEELAYQADSRQQRPPTHVDLQQFLALYLNYRPALQEPSDEVSQAFAALGADPATGM